LSGKCPQEAIQSRFVDFYLTGDFAGTTRTILQQVGHSQLDCSVQRLLDYETVTYPQQIHRRNRRPGVRCHHEPPAVAAIVSLVKDFKLLAGETPSEFLRVINAAHGVGHGNSSEGTPEPMSGFYYPALLMGV